MSISSALYSSAKQDWDTPQWLFDELNEEFNFTIDLCATEENKKCEIYCSEIFDLNMVEGVGYMNPPYGRKIIDFIRRAYVLSKQIKIVALVPARTDTKWWHEFIWDRRTHRANSAIKEIRFLKGRLKFGKATNSAPFPSVIVVFDRTHLKGEA